MSDAKKDKEQSKVSDSHPDKEIESSDINAVPDTLENEVELFESEKCAEGRGARARSRTEKGAMYNAQRFKEHIKAAITTWRKQALILETMLTDCEDINLLKSARDQVITAMSSIERSIHAFESQDEIEPNITKKVESIEEEHFQIIKSANEKIRYLASVSDNSVNSVKQLSKENALPVEDDVISIQSVRSNKSTSSDLLVAKVAALRVRMKRESAVAKLEAQLRLFKVESELEEAEASLNAIQEIGKAVQPTNTEESQIDRVEFNQKNSSSTSKNTSYANKNEYPTNGESSSENKNEYNANQNELSSGPDTSVTNHSESALNKLVDSFSNQCILSRLPAPEPEIFYGDPLKFVEWSSSFELLINKKSIPAAEKLHYLKKYLGGEALESINGLFLLNSDNAFTSAWSSLKHRYGSNYLIANAFRSKLESWPKLKQDASMLRKFSDFIHQCTVAQNEVNELRVLDDEWTNKMLLRKLPDWLVLRWGRTAAIYRKQHDRFPPFKEFDRFIKEEAELACDPITSMQSLKQDNNSDKRNARSLNSSTVKEKEHKIMCHLCNNSHDIDECPDFLKLNLQERKNYVKSNNLCFACFIPKHRSKDCRKRKTCQVCGKKHPTSLHDYNKAPNDTNITNVNSRATYTSNMDIKVGNVTTIVPVYISHESQPNKEVQAYALLDTQSDTTFVTEDMMIDLGLEGVETHLNISTITSKQASIPSKRYSGLFIRGFNGDTRYKLPSLFSREEIPFSESSIPTLSVAESWPHLKPLAQHFNGFEGSCENAILIGYDCPRLLMPLEVVPAPEKNPNAPFAIKTELGWSFIGMANSSQPSKEIMSNCTVTFCLKTTTRETISPDTVAKMMEIEFCERKSKSNDIISQDDIKFMNQLQAGTKHVNGRYEVPIPVKDPNVILPNNESQAQTRLKNLGAKLLRYPKQLDDYKAYMNKLLDDGFAEAVKTDVINGQQWYIPHHGIYNPNKPNKLRVVYDCSAQYKGTSLNDNLLKGPESPNSLVGVLMRFRRESHAVTCDIQSMFHQFGVPENQRDLFRFLWFDEGNPYKDAKKYRMTVHLFGATSSPGCTNYGLRRMATENAELYGKQASEFVTRNFYVDDGLISFDDEGTALDVMRKTIVMCENNGLKLHKFMSNRKEILDALMIDKGEIEENKLDKNLSLSEAQVERALGIHWNVGNDSLQFRVTLKDTPLTKRGMMSTVGSIYDPLGLVAPVLLKGRRLLQEVCREGGNWDDVLPDHIHAEWEKWRRNLLDISKVETPRCYKPSDFGQVIRKELHHFSDASQIGYGQCTYIRSINVENQVHCALIIGKSRVTPSKTMTIPRLELAAAVLSAKVSTFVQEELDIGEVNETYWTDSSVVLNYLRNDAKKFHIFVANRVQQIKDRSEVSQWKHVKGKNNPADIASRGCTIEELLQSEWLNGPEFLWNINLPDKDDEIVHGRLDINDPEVKRVTHVTIKQDKFSDRLQKFSNWYKLLKVIVIVLRWRKAEKPRNRHPSVKEVEEAEKRIVKLIQRESFSDEMKLLKQHDNPEDRNEVTNRKLSLRKGSSIVKLDPFIDRDGLIRVGGRIKNSDLSDKQKHPLIIPKKHWIVNMIIRYCHEKIQHQGRGMTINAIRSSGYWLINCCSVVHNYINQCTVCRRFRAPKQVQKMADLPEDRVSCAPPFTYCGADFFGPFHVKEGRKELKRYGAVFTCLNSRAVHIEVTDSLSTDSYINALRRFLAIRGPVRIIRSDCGTNFVGAINEFKQCFDEMDNDAVKLFLLNNKCDFKTNTPTASHQGGCWERQIRSIRSILSSMFYGAKTQLTDESLRTFMYEAMAIMNNRPLTYECLNDNSVEPLTPNHILTMKNVTVLPPPGKFQGADLYLHRQWRRVQHLLDIFWQRWRKEYLTSLQNRQKWHKTQRDMNVGDIVIMENDDLPRAQWKLGRVIEVIKDDDNRVRKVKLHVGTKELDKQGHRKAKLSVLERPIHKLVLLCEKD